jgi:ParB-like chromosome segregation protein Spo0J
MSRPIALNLIRCDGGTQPREKLDDAVVSEYAERIVDGDVFPPVTVFHDGTDYWLADGYHRLAAHEDAGRENISADVQQGTRRDAVLYSVGANALHGLPRTNADKRRAVTALLTDTEWSAWSNREIARRCRVSDPFVGKLREEIAPPQTVSSEERTYTTKHGTVATMDVSGIRQSAADRRTEPKVPSVADLQEYRDRKAAEPATRKDGTIDPLRTLQRQRADAPSAAFPEVAAPSVVRDTVAAARAEFRNSAEGRLAAYIDSLPELPSVAGRAVGRLHISSVEILRAHADFIGQVLTEQEKVHATA